MENQSYRTDKYTKGSSTMTMCMARVNSTLIPDKSQKAYGMTPNYRKDYDLIQNIEAEYLFDKFEFL